MFTTADHQLVYALTYLVNLLSDSALPPGAPHQEKFAIASFDFTLPELAMSTRKRKGSSSPTFSPVEDRYYVKWSVKYSQPSNWSSLSTHCLLTHQQTWNGVISRPLGGEQDLEEQLFAPTATMKTPIRNSLAKKKGLSCGGTISI